jgi:hypothetical protein
VDRLVNKKLNRPHCLIAAMRHGGHHLINPLVKKLGVAGLSADKQIGLLVPDDKLIVFMRDSRNTITSAFRWKLRQCGRTDAPLPGYDEEIAERLGIVATRKKASKYLPGSTGKTGIETRIIYWSHYLQFPNKLVVRFEDLTSETPKVQRRTLIAIKDYLGSDGDPEAIFATYYRKSTTYSGKFTDWRQWWGPKARASFAHNKGNQLLGILGYGAD